MTQPKSFKNGLANTGRVIHWIVNSPFKPRFHWPIARLKFNFISHMKTNTLMYSYTKGIVLVTVFLICIVFITWYQNAVFVFISLPIVLLIYVVIQMSFSCSDCGAMVYDVSKSILYTKFISNGPFLLRFFWIPSRCNGCGKRF